MTRIEKSNVPYVSSSSFVHMTPCTCCTVFHPFRDNVEKTRKKDAVVVIMKTSVRSYLHHEDRSQLHST